MIRSGSRRIANALRAAAPPAGIAFAVAILLRFPPERYSLYPQCPFRQLFNLQCPGCGATRALAALLRGDFAAAIHLNPLAAVLFPLAAAYGVVAYARFIKRLPIRLHLPPVAVYAALAVTLLFGVIRNLPSFQQETKRPQREPEPSSLEKSCCAVVLRFHGNGFGYGSSRTTL